MTKNRYYINLALYFIQIMATLFTLFIMVTLGFRVQDFQIITNWIAMIALGICLFYNKNLFTLISGIVLITGNFTGLTAFGTVTHNSLFFNIGSLHIPLYWGSPMYSFLLIIYLLCNKGFFIGIATKEYWTDFLTRTNDLEPIFTIVNMKEKKDNESNN